MKENLHINHRSRTRERLSKVSNFEILDDHQILEYLLWYCIPRKDTNPIGHRLMKSFGNFTEVFNASQNELKKIKGVGDSAALFFKLINETQRRIINSVTRPKRIFTSHAEIQSFAKTLHAENNVEQVYVMCFSASGALIHHEMIAEGILDEVFIEPKDVLEVAFRHKAVSLAISHNHPVGNSSPSNNDMRFTKALVMALIPHNIKLFDHMIFSNKEMYSFYKSGILDSIYKQFSK